MSLHRVEAGVLHLGCAVVFIDDAHMLSVSLLLFLEHRHHWLWRFQQLHLSRLKHQGSRKQRKKLELEGFRFSDLPF